MNSDESFDDDSWDDENCEDWGDFEELDLNTREHKISYVIPKNCILMSSLK